MVWDGELVMVQEQWEAMCHAFGAIIIEEQAKDNPKGEKCHVTLLPRRKHLESTETEYVPYITREAKGVKNRQ